MKDTLRVIHSMVPQDEIDHPAATLVGTTCYLKTDTSEGAGLLASIGVSVGGETVRVKWNGMEPTNEPQVYVIKHLQRDYSDRVVPRAYPIDPAGPAEAIGYLCEADQIVPIEQG
jgi:hypothetical protein